MMKLHYLYLIIISTLLFVGCTSDDVQDNELVELSYSIKNYNRSGLAARVPYAGAPEEQQIDNLYLLLFDGGGANPITYFVDNTFVDGTWNKVDGKVTLQLTQAEAATRQVYVVANASVTLQATLDAVTTIAALQAAMESTNTPWSPTLQTPILMSGNATHNFVSNRILNSVSLTRAFAKVELNLTLPSKHQDTDPLLYRYNFIDFDKNTYILKPTTKTDDLVTIGWQDWQAAGNVSSYTLQSGKVATLKIVTYINERDNTGSYIDIQLPYHGGGPLPPPEFGNETFKLPLPDKIERNHWYKFDITL